MANTESKGYFWGMDSEGNLHKIRLLIEAADIEGLGNATGAAAGLLSPGDKKKLDGITDSADAVAFTQSLKSGTKVGTITINGVQTDLYAPENTASSEVGSHNTSTSAHSDIRELISGLTTRLNALADSDDATLDQMSEIVGYIKSNKTLIESVTTSKVSVTDIVNDLTTNASSKPLAASQGVAIKALVDDLKSKLDGMEYVIGEDDTGVFVQKG